MTLVLVDAGRPGDRPFAVRLRRLLKHAIRAENLRCASAGYAEDVPATGGGDGAAAGEG